MSIRELMNADYANQLPNYADTAHVPTLQQIRQQTRGVLHQ